MRTRPGSVVVNQDRRQLFTTNVMGIAAATAAAKTVTFTIPETASFKH